MALRSILDIDVNDGAFKEYQAVYNKYQEAVKTLPGDWAKSTAVIEQSRKKFDELVESLVRRNYQVEQQLQAQKVADKLTQSQADSWKQMVGYTKDVTHNLIRTTENLIKWVGPIAIITGLLGAAGGLFGIDRLALSVSSTRRSAMGLGVGYGQQRAFELNYGRFVDTGALLGNVSSGLYNATSPQYTALLGAGVSRRLLASPDANAADVSVDLLNQLPRLFGGKDRKLIGAEAESRGLTDLISVQDIMAYLHSTPAERRKQDEHYKKDAGGLDVSPQDQLAYTNFITQLDRAGQQIETVLAKGLVGLAQPLADLSTAFTKWVVAFLGSDILKGWIDKLAVGLDKLAKYLGSPDLEKNVTSFITGLGILVNTIKDWKIWFENRYGIYGIYKKIDSGDWGSAANDIINQTYGPAGGPQSESQVSGRSTTNADHLGTGFRPKSHVGVGEDLNTWSTGGDILNAYNLSSSNKMPSGIFSKLGGPGYDLQFGARSNPYSVGSNPFLTGGGVAQHSTSGWSTNNASIFNGTETPDQIVTRLNSLRDRGLISNEQCVSLASAAMGQRPGTWNVHNWRRGDAASAGNLTPGTPLATFLNPDLSLSDRYAGGGSGTPGANRDHAGVFEDYIRDSSGHITGMDIAEQYAGSGGIHSRAYTFGAGAGEQDAANYYTIHPYQSAGTRPRVDINSATGGSPIINNAQAAN